MTIPRSREIVSFMSQHASSTFLFYFGLDIVVLEKYKQLLTDQRMREYCFHQMTFLNSLCLVSERREAAAEIPLSLPTALDTRNTRYTHMQTLCNRSNVRMIYCMIYCTHSSLQLGFFSEELYVVDKDSIQMRLVVVCSFSLKAIHRANGEVQYFLERTSTFFMYQKNDEPKMYQQRDTGSKLWYVSLPLHRNFIEPHEHFSVTQLTYISPVHDLLIWTEL